MALRLLFRTNFRDVSTGSRFFKKSILKKIRLSTNSPFIGAELQLNQSLKVLKLIKLEFILFHELLAGSSVGLKI